MGVQDEGPSDQTADLKESKVWPDRLVSFDPSKSKGQAQGHG
jgi:hypothetical protein